MGWGGEYLALGGVPLKRSLEGAVTKGTREGELAINTAKLDHATRSHDAVALLRGSGRVGLRLALARPWACGPQ